MNTVTARESASPPTSAPASGGPASGGPTSGDPASDPSAASLSTLEPVRILSPESVQLLTTRQRIGMYDQTFRHVMDWSLGLIMSSNRYGDETVPYGYGVDCSDDTFGHGGSQSSVGFADPEFGLVVTVVMNGMPGEAIHHGHMNSFLAALYQDLGLA